VTDLRPGPETSDARQRAYEVVFEHHTPAGRAFDVALILAILLSVGAVVLESVGSLRATHGPLLRALEWGFTILFTVEYLLRLWCVSRAWGYARSFFGIIDLLAVIPTYLAVLLPGGQVLAVVRILRVLRVFRILKLGQYVGEARLLGAALRASRVKITVFLFTVLTLVVILGSLMYLIEGRQPDSGFSSIPVAMYWAVVTLTTVGYGDVAPVTALGQTLATVIMIMGYGIIAVPTGIVSVELAHASRGRSGATASDDDGATPAAPVTREEPHSLYCPTCGWGHHDRDARHCKRCGDALSAGPMEAP
jgi:voltage-gated potassium channel